MSDSPFIRNDLLKSIHIRLLQTLGLETRHFWKLHPLNINGITFGESALLEHIWKEGTHSPLEYLTQVLESLEPFLLERGISVEDFVDQITYWGNRGTFLDPKFLLKTLNPLVSKLFSSSDVMSFLLMFTEVIGSRLVKGLSFPILKRESLENKKRVYAMVRVEQLFNQNLTPWDGYLYSAKLLQLTPRVLGLPGYDAVDLLSDARPIEKILGVKDSERREDALYISGKRMGIAAEFSAFCTLHDLEIKKQSLPPTQGIVMEADYFCPIRKRIVLRKGCFYGAPAYLFKIVYTLKPRNFEHHLFNIIEEATREDQPSWKELEQLHLDLVERTKECLVIEYRSLGDAIIIGNKKLISGNAAKILRRILREYQALGKTEFLSMDFTNDPEIYHNPKNNGFEMAFKRLSDCLAASGYSIALTKKSKGKMSLTSQCKIDFKESSNTPAYAGTVD